MQKEFLKKRISSSNNKKQGTRFKEKVYKIVQKIPEGNFLTYKKVAELVGSPRAWRAVGNILNKNRDPKIPCHRVIRSDGKIGGFNRGTKEKIALLKKEGDLIKI
jgi:O-6-methylguanine DNA methyltransferase